MRYPTISALRALDAVARLGSVTAAAQQLSLTRSAISHQIISLEQSLGFALTERVGRGIGLTHQGQCYALEVRRILADIQDAGRLFDGPEVSGKLRISCNPGFTSFWLSNHINGFQRQYPQVRLHVVNPRSWDDTSDAEADLFITYGIGDWPGLQVEPIFTLHFSPVCSPRLINAIGGLKTPQDLAGLPLIHMNDTSDWRAWLAAAGVEQIDADSGITFSDAHCAQSACIAAQGVAIGDSLLSGNALARGLLVRPFDIAISARRGYFLAIDPAKAERPAVRAFSTWLKYQLQNTTQGITDSLLIKP